jgi:hypothetical protein
VTAKAPRAFNRHVYHRRNIVFYGTDDGHQDGSFGEFTEFEAHYRGTPARRRKDIHMISVVGGMYGLNLIPLWRPTRITIFDINPIAVTYFGIVRRVWTTSRDAAHFLARLTDGDYDVSTEDERFVQENIALRRRNALPRSRGSSKRSYEESWGYALDRFALTRRILGEAPLEVRTEAMESPGFRSWLREQRNVWCYCSNIAEFVYFDVEFADPSNVVFLAILFPARTDLLDLAPLGGGPARVKIQIPMRAERIGEAEAAPPARRPRPRDGGAR